MQKDSQTITTLQHYFMVFSMFIVTLYSYQNSATFQLAEMWFWGHLFHAAGPIEEYVLDTHFKENFVLIPIM